MGGMRGYKESHSSHFSPKFQPDLWRHKLITGLSCTLSPSARAFMPGDALGNGGTGPRLPCQASLQCQVLLSHLVFDFPVSRYQDIYIYIFRTLCPASSKLCKISPLLCDFHSLVQRLEERIGAIPYLRAQPPVSSSSLTSHLFPLIALHRILSCRQDLLPFHSAQWELPRWAENVLFT